MNKSKMKKPYQSGGRGPKNPNTNTNKNKKYRRYGEDYDPKETQSKQNLFGAPINDIKWYRDNEQLLNDVCRLAYNIPVGMPFNHRGKLIPSMSNEFWSIPGIAVMNVVPTFGWARNPSDPVNVAFAGMFTFIRSHTSSKFDWDDNTLGVNMLATDSLYYFTKFCIRAYATLPLFHQANKYLPQALLEAQGIDYRDLLANAAEFRKQLNLRIERINALKIPSEIYVFARHMWLFENYYIEGTSVKDQIYCYKPAAYYVHTKDSNGISMLECHRTETGATGTNGLLTAADLIRKLDAMLDPIFNDQYFNLISGYIEQAYEGKVMSLPIIPDEISLPLVFSEEVLLQFKNAKPLPVRHATSGAGYLNGTFDLRQEPASASDIRVCLKTTVDDDAFRVYRSLNDNIAVDVDASSSASEKYNMFVIANEYSRSKIITTPHADVVPAENMINTRLIPAISASTVTAGAPDFNWNLQSFGTEWPISVEVVTRWLNSTTQQIENFAYELHNTMYYDTTDSNAGHVVNSVLPVISVFKYLPELRIVSRMSSIPDALFAARLQYFEIDNMALLTAEDLTQIHNSALMCMLRVPEIASTSLSAR